MAVAVCAQARDTGNSCFWWTKGNGLKVDRTIYSLCSTFNSSNVGTWGDSRIMITPTWQLQANRPALPNWFYQLWIGVSDWTFTWHQPKIHHSAGINESWPSNARALKTLGDFVDKCVNWCLWFPPRRFAQHTTPSYILRWQAINRAKYFAESRSGDEMSWISKSLSW